MPMPSNLKPKASDLARIITGDPAHDVVTDVTEVTSILGAVDVDATWDEEDAKIVTEIWDGKTPINGFTVTKSSHPEIMKMKDDGHDIFLIKDENGHVLQLQWHEPDVEGHIPMPKGTGSVRALQHKVRHVHGRVMQRVLSHTAEQARQKRVAEGKAVMQNSLNSGIRQPILKGK